MQSTVSLHIPTTEEDVQRVLNRLKLKANTGLGPDVRYVDANRKGTKDETSVVVRMNVEAVDPTKEELEGFVTALEAVMKNGSGVKFGKITVLGVNPL